MGYPPSKVRMLSELSIRDRVRTPTGREAVVMGFQGEKVRLSYCAGGGGCDLSPHHLTIVERAPQRTLSISRICESEAKAAIAKAARRDG